MGSCISTLEQESKKLEKKALESYLMEDVESFNLAVKEGSRLQDIKTMNKRFLEKLAEHPEINYPKKILSFAIKYGDRKLTSKLLENAINHNNFNVEALKTAIVNDDVSAVTKMLKLKPWLSNEPVLLSSTEGLLPFESLRNFKYLPNADPVTNAKNSADILNGIKNHNSIEPVTVMVRPLAIALYKASDDIVRLTSNNYREQTNIDANKKIVESLVNSGADCIDKMYGEFSTSYQIVRKHVPQLTTPLKYAQDFTNEEVFNLVKNGVVKTKNRQLEMISKIKTKEQSPSKKSIIEMGR